MARRTASGCDAALRPRGRAQVARTERRRPHWHATWQEATRSRGLRGCLCGAPHGRLVSGGPTGIVGPG